MQHDLTQGSISRRLLGMAAFIGLGLLFQTLYFLIDLYFIAHLGPAAIAGVGLAGNLFFLVMALVQTIGVGALSLIARGIGARQIEDATAVYRQSVLMSVIVAVVVLAAGYLFAEPALRSLAADEATVRAGVDYLHGFLPALGLMFLNNAMGSALRAAGVVRPTMLVQTGTVLLNAVLAPVLVAGWGTGVPLGTFGAGLASSIAALVGFIAALWLFGRVQTLFTAPLKIVAFSSAVWRRVLGIGLPSGAEFLLMFITTGLVYGVIRHFGPEAQAGYGVGGRVMQAIFLPAMAVSFAVAPVAGQNFGAGLADRVRRTVRDAAVISSVLMLVLTLLCQIRPEFLIGLFTPEPEVIAVGATFLRIISLNFLATGIIFTASGAFQALGDTRPALFGSVSRLFFFAAPAVWVSTQPWARLEHIWWLSAGSVLVHMGIALWFLRRELRVKLAGLTPRGADVSAS